MRNPFRNLRLSMKTSLLGVGSVLVTLAALVALVVWQSGQFHALAQSEVDKLINANLDNITQGVFNLVRTEHEAAQKQVNDNLNVARHLLAEAGAVELSTERTPWEARNQFTGESKLTSLPKILLGGRWLKPNADPSRPTPAVDGITQLVGDTATIFQRMNERGDMLRVATTVRDDKGRRAVGTYIPATNSDGKPNPVIAEVRAGRTYRGRAYVVREWYLTAYEPLRNSRGELVGMLYVGVRQKTVEARVRQAILNTSVGKTGYVYVLTGRGEDRGHYVISQRGERDGEDIGSNRDSDGNLVIQSIIAKATALRPGELATAQYRWINPGEVSPRWKIARLAYFEPWDWVIGTSVYLDELQGFHAVLQGGRVRMTRIMALAGAGLALGVALVGFLLSWTLTRPLHQMTQAVGSLLRGDREHPLEVNSQDEIGILAEAFNLMAERLRQTLTGLRESEHRYRSIFEEALEGIVQSNSDGQILTANPALARALGYESPEELIRLVSELGQCIYVDKSRREELRARLEQDGSVASFEAEWYRKDRSTMWANIKASAVKDSQGQLVVINSLVEDITERKRAEEALEHHRDHLEELVELRTAQLRTAKDEAEAATRSKSIFLANMSHELRTPLNAVIGYAQLMARGAQDPEARTNLERILHAGEHLLGLINDVLSLSKIEAGRLTLIPIPFSPEHFFQDIGHMMQPRAFSKGLAFRLELLGAWPKALQGDGQKLRQVLVNLLGNAIKFTDQGSVVMTISRMGELTRFSVSDTGVGIAPKDVARLFRPFEQVGDGRRNAEGTGLGLHISQAIVNLMGGRIEVDSRPGQGTTFQFEIPLPGTLAPPQTRTMPRQLLPGKSNLRQLVVDDVEDNRDLLHSLFGSFGFEVHTAFDGKHALAQWESQFPDVVWMDLRMAGMDGWEATRQIRKREAELGRPRTTIIALTASALDLDPSELKEAGFDDWLLKPIQEALLIEKLEAHRGLLFEVDEAVSPPLHHVLGADSLLSLDPGWRKEFQIALILGEAERMLALLNQLEVPALADTLRALVHDYRHDTLKELFRGDHV